MRKIRQGSVILCESYESSRGTIFNGGWRKYCLLCYWTSKVAVSIDTDKVRWLHVLFAPSAFATNKCGTGLSCLHGAVVRLFGKRLWLCTGKRPHKGGGHYPARFGGATFSLVNGEHSLTKLTSVEDVLDFRVTCWIESGRALHGNKT